MKNFNVFEDIREENKNNMIIIFLISIIVFGVYIIRLGSLIDGQSNFEFTRSEFIRFFNAILAALGVLSCLLSYSSNKKKELFLISLMYIVFLLDICISNQLNYESNNVEVYLAIGTTFIRVVIALISISNMENLKGFIIENKVKAFIIVVISTFMVTYIEYNYKISESIMNMEFFIAYNILLFFIYLFIAVIFYIKSISEKEYIYGVIASSILMFATKSIYSIASYIYTNDEIRLTSVSITYIGFIMFILGLFIELSENVKKNKKLEEQKGLFFSIVEESKHNNIIICDEKYNIKYLNKKAISSRKEEYSDYLCRDREYKLNIDKIFKGKILFDEIEECLQKYDHYNKEIYIEGEDIFIDISIQLFKKNDKRYKVVIIKDVSEKYKMQTALLEYKNMKKEERMKNEFFANISHELKTPLNIIYSTMQLLNYSLDKNNFKEIYLKYKNSLDINCKRMLRLIDNIVDITKLEVGFKVPDFSNYDIVRLVEGISTSVVNYAKVKEIDVIFDTDVEELNIKCDPDMIERVMLNLLSNAIKFSDNGGTILVDMSTTNKWVSIKVKDEGIGIPIEIQDKIFDRFVQSDKSLRRENEGSGIGLSITKSIVELMGGNINLKSDGVRGTEFTILLPNEVLEEENSKKIVSNVYKVDIQKIQLEFSDIYELYDVV
ncbi:MFS domain-containing histidine kinase [Romboutsia sp. 1001216sp1]|uniref:MFS domain-containing histidine kinase n=1 Tax=unclassified Romboutsia TaxID=2626894 RepID=UPI0018A8A89A|nr:MULTISPECIES: MFS domain-containing histidine kinase [unclassified Romboutsia]MDB8792240.1 MFS domain-containing histidine kinase [Romboutsia sp. 1001216sp1]MDB8795534.1 MFS domain-containing histidine kinase [Romboutsia sp. 1001216sp1]MDB8798587.1 MFS domain-containing histidine kinase [Romboutsia sp. 1001216sp1]